MSRAVRAALLLALLPPLAACGPRALAVGSKPFPAAQPVFVDASGKRLSALPAAPEPARLVLLDFPWCPACADTWKALLAVSDQLPPESARVFRILFDRETAISATGRREGPPLHPAPLPGFADTDGPGGLAVTTLTALPGAFLGEYRLSQAPVLLLLAADGTVAYRWIGYSPALAGEVAGEIRKRFLPLSPLPPER